MSENTIVVLASKLASKENDLAVLKKCRSNVGRITMTLYDEAETTDVTIMVDYKVNTITDAICKVVEEAIEEQKREISEELYPVRSVKTVPTPPEPPADRILYHPDKL